MTYINKPYVYKLIHKESGEFYFGYREANKEPSELDFGIKYRTSSSVIDKMGFSNFHQEIIYEFDDELRETAINKAYDLEQRLIKSNFDDILCLNQQYVDIDSGKHRFKQNPETVEKIRAFTQTTEYKTKMSIANTGKTRSDEYKEASRLVNQGRKHSEESRNNMANGQIGRKHSAETRLKITSANIGNKNGLGHRNSDDTKAKKSESARLAWARKREAKMADLKSSDNAQTDTPLTFPIEE